MSPTGYPRRIADIGLEAERAGDPGPAALLYMAASVVALGRPQAIWMAVGAVREVIEAECPEMVGRVAAPARPVCCKLMREQRDQVLMAWAIQSKLPPEAIADAADLPLEEVRQAITTDEGTLPYEPITPSEPTHPAEGIAPRQQWEDGMGNRVVIESIESIESFLGGRSKVQLQYLRRGRGPYPSFVWLDQFLRWFPIPVNLAPGLTLGSTWYERNGDPIRVRGLTDSDVEFDYVFPKGIIVYSLPETRPMAREEFLKRYVPELPEPSKKPG